jgi:hypothetical protein
MSGKASRNLSAWRVGDEGHFRAKMVLSKAVAQGRLIRPKLCTECNRGPATQPKWADYKNPLDVRWLCPDCVRGEREREAWAVADAHKDVVIG